jgi:hypothetical protein
MAGHVVDGINGAGSGLPNSLMGISNNAGFRRVIGYQCGPITTFECDLASDGSGFNSVTPAA